MKRGREDVVEARVGFFLSTRPRRSRPALFFCDAVHGGWEAGCNMLHQSGWGVVVDRGSRMIGSALARRI